MMAWDVDIWGCFNIGRVAGGDDDFGNALRCRYIDNVSLCFICDPSGNNQRPCQDLIQGSTTRLLVRSNYTGSEGVPCLDSTRELQAPLVMIRHKG